MKKPLLDIKLLHRAIRGIEQVKEKFGTDHVASIVARDCQVVEMKKSLDLARPYIASRCLCDKKGICESCKLQITIWGEVE